MGKYIVQLRFVYEIFEEEVSVTLIQSLGHYNDK